MKSLLLAALIAATRGTDFYVDPTAGDDAGDGSAAAPFKSLARAQAAVRTATKNGTVAGAMTVHAAAGTYDLARAPLVLGPEDSGAPGARVSRGAERTPRRASGEGI